MIIKLDEKLKRGKRSIFLSWDFGVVYCYLLADGGIACATRRGGVFS